MVKFPDGDTYEGEWVGNMRDGYGVYTWEDGAVYSGTSFIIIINYLQDIGKMTKWKERGSFSMRQVKFMTVIGRIINEMDLECTFRRMVQSI